MISGKLNTQNMLRYVFSVLSLPLITTAPIPSGGLLMLFACAQSCCKPREKDHEPL